MEGTNITINELENYILETNHKQSSIKNINILYFAIIIYKNYI